MPGIVAGMPAVVLVAGGEDDAERRGAPDSPMVEIRPVMGGELFGVPLHRATSAIATAATS